MSKQTHEAFAGKPARAFFMGGTHDARRNGAEDCRSEGRDAAFRPDPSPGSVQAHFSVTQPDIENLLDDLDSVCNTTTNTSSQLIQFRPTGSFHTYSVYDKNCFVAVSIWMNALGIVNLSDFVSGSLSKRMYTNVLYTQIGKFNGWSTVTL
ncbi:MAG: hypothetical protein SPH82_00340 [Eubacteriales bacterium]|nr:hypothetical protein [Eubacteriales bacterium]